MYEINILGKEDWGIEMRNLKKILLGIWLIIGILATCKYASVLIDDGGVVTETVTITKIVELPGHSFKRTYLVGINENGRYEIACSQAAIGDVMTIYNSAKEAKTSDSMWVLSISKLRAKERGDMMVAVGILVSCLLIMKITSRAKGHNKNCKANNVA